MNGIYIIIGGNLGNRPKNMQLCRKEIAENIGEIIAASSLYETAAWGKEDEPDYLNQVIYVQSNQIASAVLDQCLGIEHRLGRTRNVKWEARLIDIDILFFNHDIIDEPRLHIPHPRMHTRKFVLIPLNEIAPDFVHPVLRKNIHELLLSCSDPLEVRRVENNQLPY